MLQINVQPYASDALEDAMRLAQTKALNSYSFSDCLNYLNYAWSDIYQQIAMIDDGFYSRTVRLTKKLTKLPPFLKSTIKVYSAQSPVGFDRKMYKASGYNDLTASGTYHISGFDLWCPDAERATIWLNYIPMQPQIFFTHHNRDPKLYETFDPVVNTRFNLYDLIHTPVPYKYELVHKDITTGIVADITDTLLFKGNDWELIYITCDFPYIFVTYQHRFTGEHYSGFFPRILESGEFVEFNPFAFTGRNSDVEYLSCKWNDKTGMGVVIKDYNDAERIKELGWTPDTLLIYPAPEMYRLLVARLADKFSALNESNVMGVSKELTEATFAFQAFLKKDKSAWQRIDNVTGPTIGDYL